MRFGSVGLSLLILAIATALATSPAGAADQGDVGVVENKVEIRASSTMEGEDWGSDPDCVYEVVVEDDIPGPVYDTDGTRLFSETGRWLRKICDGEETPVGGQVVFPEGDAFTIPDLLQQAVDSLDPAEPTWAASPNGTSVAMVTQMPVWLWVEPVYWGAAFDARVETPGGRVWAEAHAEPSFTTWSPGDGSTAVCEGPGRQWAPGLDASPTDCTHTYRTSTAGTTGYPMTVTVTFEVTGETSIDGPVALGPITRTSGPVVVQVGEIQAIETN
ncbi:MAG: hypothetical protein KDB16_19470 [Acidimicrobiales bacterium]|nr:hypothetical protein [Acidimicrobiales bacterium]